MMRILFTYIVPFLLPSAIYVAWGWYRTRYVAAHAGQPPGLERGPWALLIFLKACSSSPWLFWPDSSLLQSRHAHHP